MSRILALTSSAVAGASVSNELVKTAIAKLTAADPSATVVERDLATDPLPHLTQDGVAALRGEPATPAQVAIRQLSDTLVEELKAADVIIIGAPMYNFGIPTTLKAWFDHVLRAGVTFSYTETGPKGLVTGKRAIVIETRGGLYSEGPAMIMDSQEPHLRGMLGFIGISDVTFVRAEKLGFGPEARDAAVAAATAQLADLAAKAA
jgi:FMN-dependent NADH-azoreductase